MSERWVCVWHDLCSVEFKKAYTRIWCHINETLFLCIVGENHLPRKVSARSLLKELQKACVTTEHGRLTDPSTLRHQGGIPNVRSCLHSQLRVSVKSVYISVYREAGGITLLCTASGQWHFESQAQWADHPGEEDIFWNNTDTHYQ